MRPTRFRSSFGPLGWLAAGALVLGACGDGSDAPDDGQSAPDASEDAGQDGEATGEQDLELPDPRDHVEDGVFRGIGVMMPAPEGWQFDQASFAQGMVVALTEDGSQTIAGQAVDTDDVEQELGYEDLVDSSREELGGDPAADEQIELVGADRAHLLRFDELPAQDEEAPTNTLLTLIADGGDGELAMFNYVAPTDEYDEATEQLLIDQSGFDPDSDPAAPLPIE